MRKNGLTSYSTRSTTTLTTGKRRIFDAKRFGYEHPDLREKYMVDVDFELLTYRAF